MREDRRAQTDELFDNCIAYNAHIMEAILLTVAPALSWR
jgi:hypothetical protein